MQIDLTLTEPQDDFVFSEAQYPLFVGGFGAGKSESLFKRLLIQKLTYPKLNQGYFAPSYDLISLIAMPRLEELLIECGLKFKLNKSEKVFYVQGYGQIIMRSMDNPASIVGFEIADAVIDELDTMQTEKAREAWNKVIARCRQRKPDGKPNTTAVGTTPEGFRFCYERWQKNATEKYVLYRAPTASNPYLPDSYIDGLRETYPPALLNAYLEGQFVNLASGGVYPDFDRKLNHTDEEIRPGEPLFVGMDFNVLKMAAVVYVIRNGRPMALDEVVNARDTRTMVQLLRDRFKSHHITVFPDAAGQATSSKNASESDHSILRSFGFSLEVNGSNPAIKDRINAVNALICNGNGERLLLVNTNRCPHLTEALEQQVYDKHGMPDKSTGHDHMCFTGETLVKTKNGVFRFDELSENGFVLGVDGDWVEYSNARLIKNNEVTISVSFANGYVVKCTPDHKFLTGDGLWLEAKDLRKKKCVLSLKQSKSSMESGITNAELILQIIRKLESVDFIELFGNITLEKYQEIVIFIISTMMKQTIRLKTLLASQDLAINNGTDLCLKELKECVSLLMSIATLQKNGTLVKKVENGIENITKEHQVNLMQHLQQTAQIVELNLSSEYQAEERIMLSAQENAYLHIDVQAVSMMLRELASCVVMYLKQTNTLIELDVTNIKEDTNRSDVYCLNTKQGAFKLCDESPIVSNCDAAGYFLVKRFPIVRKSSRQVRIAGLL